MLLGPTPGGPRLVHQTVEFGKAAKGLLRTAGRVLKSADDPVGALFSRAAVKGDDIALHKREGTTGEVTKRLQRRIFLKKNDWRQKRREERLCF
jgi:hypothetical protein